MRRNTTLNPYFDLYRDPVEMVVLRLADTDGGEAIELEEANGGVYHGITMEELRAKWHETVCGLAKREIAVTNPENALKGALSIRYVQQSSEADTTVFASPTPLFHMLVTYRMWVVALSKIISLLFPRTRSLKTT